MNNRKVLLGILAVVVVAGIVGTLVFRAPNGQGRPNDSSEGQFLIGVLAPLTGEVADYGTRGKNGVQLAVEELNAAGGIRGKSIKVIIEDDKGSPKDAVAAMQKLINVDKVPVVVGGLMSGVGLAIAPLAEQNKVVLLAPGSSNPSFRDAGDYSFRNWASDDLDGKIMASYMFKTKNIRSVAVLTMQNDYCLGLSQAFKRDFLALGGKIVAEEQFPPETSRFQDILTKLKGATFDAVFLSAQPKEGGFAAKQMAELAIHTQIASNFAVDSPEFLGIAGGAAEGVFFTTPAFDPTSKDPTISQFVSKYRQRYGADPDTTAGHFYDAVRIIAAAANAAKDSSPTAIKDALYSVTAFPGVTGTTTLDDHGDVTKPVMIKIIREGKAELVELYGGSK